LPVCSLDGVVYVQRKTEVVRCHDECLHPGSPADWSCSSAQEEEGIAGHGVFIGTAAKDSAKFHFNIVWLAKIKAGYNKPAACRRRRRPVLAKRWNAEAAAINSAGVQIPRGADPHLASGTCFGLELPDCGLALIAAQLLFEGFVGFTEAGVPWDLLGASREI
jgi:hypothetical protein